MTVARIVFGSYLVRYPLGGMVSYVLQYLLGLRALGHDVFFVEKANYPLACFDPARRVMTDDGRIGFRIARRLFRHYGLGEQLSFVDYAGRYHGLPRKAVEEAFVDAIFIDMGTHGSWLDEASHSALRILIDGEPGYNHIRMVNDPHSALHNGYDVYATNGRNVGRPGCSVPTGQIEWRHIFHPVVLDFFESPPASANAPYTTVMNWKAHSPITYNGVQYGQKDVEFEKFVGLPSRTNVPLEVSVAGPEVPRQWLVENGWRANDAHTTTRTLSGFLRYLQQSRGEFSVCKEVFVALHTGWFSDRSAAYLAAGRPVVVQDTGLADHLPLGCGLFAVSNVDEAAAALEDIESAYVRHSRAAKEIAREYLDTRVVLPAFLSQAGV